MRTAKWYVTLGLLIACSLSASAVTFTVSKDASRGQFTSIQEAIDNAGHGDSVKILDTEIYEEQITIDSSVTGLTLTSANPTSLEKPTIVWQDTENVHPTTREEAEDESMITFDQNGALRVMRTSGITIDGIAVQGGGAFVFGGESVWYNPKTRETSALLHGNAAITLFVSGDVIIRNCDISDAYLGIYFKDRNEGGIYANANPSDLEPWNVVPLSGFGKTGNHLVEHNRIHNNSFGMFFESTWDLGSTVRYNLIYENYHQTADIITDMVAVAENEADAQQGGAFFSKDHSLSPLAIHNNTFWHNYVLFQGHWRSGTQFLIFNNIFSSPNEYITENAWRGMEGMFPNRMKSCLFASQSKEISKQCQNYNFTITDPETNENHNFNHPLCIVQDVTISENIPSNSFDKEPLDIDVTFTMPSGDTTVTITTGETLLPGAEIGGDFAPGSEVRWLETDYKDTVFSWELFQSTDPEDPLFLVPDWEHPLVKEFIIDKGWSTEAGPVIVDKDGSNAEIGAFSYTGRAPEVIKISPLETVRIKDGKATVRFDLTSSEGLEGITSPEIKYFRFIKNVVFPPDNKNFANNLPIIEADAIIEVPSQPVSMGENTLEISVPPRGEDEHYAFFEMVVEGTNKDGDKVSSAFGFLPYRRLDYELIISVYEDAEAEDAINTVNAGDTVFLEIAAFEANGTPFNKPIEVDISLFSKKQLLNPDYTVFTEGKKSIPLHSKRWPVIFTKVPESGIEYVKGAGEWKNPESGQNVPFPGTSDGITVLPGPPAKVRFENPPSNTVSSNPPVIDPGVPFSGALQVYDRFDNKVNVSSTVRLNSLLPSVGDFVGSADGGGITIETDAKGVGEFDVQVGPQANENDVFTIQAQIGMGSDDADLKVGKPLDKFWIFYGDTGAFNNAKKLEGQVGEKLPIQIWASKDGKVVTERDNEITIKTDQAGAGMQFFASFDAEEPATVFPVVAGRANLWVTSPTPIDDGKIQVRDVNDNTVVPGSRSQVFFKRTKTAVESAEFHSNNGFGRVDSVFVLYKKELAFAPDSLALYWPEKSEANRIVLPKDALTLSEDNLSLSITLTEAFPEGVTVGLGSGISYDRPNPDVPVDSSFFDIEDKVGPILTEAKVYERFYPGNDTFIVTFSEDVNLASVREECFTLIKKTGNPIDLDLAGMATSVEGEITVRFAILNELDVGVDAPEEGDSLKIIGGTIEDALGNTAHPLNRAVPITIISKPVPIDRSWYKDGNADGIVDTIVIDFAQNIRDLAEINISAKWVDANIEANNIPTDRLSYSEGDSSLIFVDVNGVFSNAQDLTSGSMNVTVKYLSFTDESDSEFAADSAAPVIKAARFLPGEIIDENNSEPNKLIVTFSESIVEDITSMQEPFLFIGIGSSNYQMLLSNGIKAHTEYTFLVDTLIGIDYPSSNDSIWISVDAGIQDHSGNVQKITTNKRVKIAVTPKPYKLTIKTGPNPFVPGKPFENLPADLAAKIPFNGGAVIRIDPLTFIDDANGPGLEVLNATIYDAVGNKIATCMDALDANERMAIFEDSDPGSSIMYIAWSGHNMQGRVVGPGTYILHFIVKGNDDVENSFVTKIGVKPQE